MTASALEEGGAEPLARHFMAQFYEAKPDDVQVTILNDDPRLTLARAEFNGHVCRIEMAPAPESVTARFGWLVGSIQCAQ